MSFLEIMLIGVSLAMDAICVSVSNGISTNGNKLKSATINSLLFGIFQGIMPLIGYLAGNFFIAIFSRYSNYIVSLIFFILGLKMIFDSFHKDMQMSYQNISLKLLLIQSIATSIDALAVGIGFSAIKLNIIICCIIISTTTIVLTFIAFLLGKKIKNILDNKAEFFCGVLLIVISLKNLICNFI